MFDLHIMRSFSLSAVVVLAASAASADEPAVNEPLADAEAGATPIESLSIEDLLSTEVQVASKTARTLRESPAVVSVVTRAEIQAAGARDLLDVLRLVPGFEPNVDVQGVTGLGFRGIWGHEGKILLLIDGHELNETAYSTLQLGH